MTSEELSEYIIWSAVEPFGGDTDFIGHAVVARQVANSFLGEGEDPHTLDEFIPKFSSTPETPQSEAQMVYAAKTLTVAFGAVDISNDAGVTGF